MHEKSNDGYLCEVVGIDKMEHGFMPGRGTVDVIFILKRLKNSGPKMRSCFLKRLLIKCPGKLLIFYFELEG